MCNATFNHISFISWRSVLLLEETRGLGESQLILRVEIMAFNATFNNISFISWWSVLLVAETGENHQPGANHLQTVSQSVVSSTPRHYRNSNSQTSVVICTNCTGSCKFLYHTIWLLPPLNYKMNLHKTYVTLSIWDIVGPSNYIFIEKTHTYKWMYLHFVTSTGA